MNLLIDNTGLHRAGVVLGSPPDRAIFLSDAMALLHLAEHIMFSEQLAFSTFEADNIREISESIKTHLDRRGWTLVGSNQSLLSVKRFTEHEYARACDEAVIPILEDLGRLQDRTTLEGAIRVAHSSTGPFGVAESPMNKWVLRHWNEKERRTVRENALAQNANGAYDYIIADHERVFHTIRDLARNINLSKKRLPLLACVLDVVFRVAINDKLAQQLGMTYSPAPQRAKVTHNVDRLFRHMIERMIMESAHENQGHYASELLERIAGLERLPLPLFAIHYLRAAKANSPSTLLEAAIRLRGTPEVTSWRRWLARAVSSASSRTELSQQVDEVKRSLNLIDQPINLFSLAKLEIKGGAVESGLSVDASGASILIGKLRAKLSSRKVFLAALKHDLMSEHDLGGVLYSLIGRQITTKPLTDIEWTDWTWTLFETR